jgi:hypothetical protein
MKMDEHNDRQIRDALKQSSPSVNTELGRDLWPDVLRRLDARSVNVPWYDWVLVGLSTAMFLVFPRLVLVFAYHL